MCEPHLASEHDKGTGRTAPCHIFERGISMSINTSDLELSRRELPKIDPDEFAVAAEEAKTAERLYTHTFNRPFQYNGQTVTKLSFDFEKLTGRDCLAVENEMRMQGITMVSPTFSGPYLVRMAARACTEKVGSDIFELMPAADFTRIRNRTQSFFMRSE